MINNTKAVVRRDGLLRSLFDNADLGNILKDLKVPTVGLQDHVEGKNFHTYKGNEESINNSTSHTKECENQQLLVEIAMSIVETILRPFSIVYPKIVIHKKDMYEGVFFWLKHVKGGTWSKLLKERIAYLFAYASKQQTLPVLKFDKLTYGNPKYLLPGALGRIILQKTLSTGRRASIWRSTLLNGIKRGAPSVSDETVLENLSKHRDTLSKDKGPVEKRLRATITRTAKEIFKGMNLNLSKVTLGMTISQNSCYESTRATQGAFGLISEGLQSVHFGTVFHENQGIEDIYTNKLPTLEKLLNIRERMFDYLDNRVENVDDRSSFVNRDWFVQYIREPLKVRVLTRGPAIINSCFPDIQKRMWKQLQKYPQFKLTAGAELSAEESIFEEKIVENKKKHNTKKKNESTTRKDYIITDDPARVHSSYGWVSGDFSAATDEIKSDATRAVIEALPDGLFRKILEENLLNCNLKYPEINGTQLEDTRMCNGQLMGSCFSFPILCIINLACYRHVYETRAGRSIAIKYLPVLINGDDILYYSSNEFRREWENVTKEAGLIPTIGKSYFSYSFNMVNSRLLETDGKKILQPVPFVNMGLVCGKKKGDESDGLARSLRQKMSKLSGALSDLSHDFNFSLTTDSNVYSRAADLALSRRDIELSGFSRTHLGLDPRTVVFDGIEMEKYIHTDITLNYIRSKQRQENLRNKVAFSNLEFKDSRICTTWADIPYRNYSEEEFITRYARNVQTAIERRTSCDDWAEVLNGILGLDVSSMTCESNNCATYMSHLVQLL